MDSGPIVFDISSDDEPDEFLINKCEDAISYVDLDRYLSSVKNNGCVRPKNDDPRDDSDDDCVVLEEDPDKPTAAGDDKRDGDGSDDLCVVGQKGQVACRDFPHSRHLCANFPFSTTSHEKHCNLCHCFVCDSPAPCNYWGNGISFSDHCHATDKDETWRYKRKQFKKTNTATLPSQVLPVLKRPPIRNTRPIIMHNHPPPSPIMPNQPSRPPTLRPCSAAITSTAYLPTRRPHQNPTNISHHRQSSLESSWSAVTRRKRVHRSVSALAPISLSPFKRVGASGSMTQPQRPQQPRPIVLSRTQSMPVNSQRSPCTPLTTQRSQNDDSIRQWQDIIAGVAAELGVSECVSQPYTPTSSSQASDMSSQGMGLHTNVDPTTFSSKSIDFDNGWLDGTSQNLPGRGPAISANNDDLSRDIQLGSLFAPLENTAFVPGKESGLLEEDPASFLYGLDCSWSSIANVKPL